MKDRVPTPGQEGRVKITPESGGATYYAKIEMADNPTQLGDEPIKANLLPDDVATALGLTGNPQVKDALEKIKTLVDGNTTLANSKVEITTGSYTGTGVAGYDNPNTVPLPDNARFFEIVCAKMSDGRFFWDTSHRVEINLGVITETYQTYAYTGTDFMYVKKVGNVLYYYADQYNYQKNESGAKYYWQVFSY